MKISEKEITQPNSWKHLKCKIKDPLNGGFFITSFFIHLTHEQLAYRMLCKWGAICHKWG